ncbi:MAG: DUF3857 domain-containing protein [Terriglobales bacterium]
MPLRRYYFLACILGVLSASRAVAQPPALPLPAMQPTLVQLLYNAQPWLASPARLRDNQRQFPRAGSVQLYHLRYEQVVPNGLSALVVQRIFQIRNRWGAQQFVPDNVWYDSARGQFQLVLAEVWRRNRQGSYRAVAHGQDRGNLSGWAVGTQPRRIQLPALRAGDRVSLLYVILPNTGPAWTLLGGHFLGNLFAFRDSFATESVRYVLAARQAMAVSAARLPAPQRGRGRTGLQTWEWEAGDQPAFFQTTGEPAITDVSPFVQVSGFTTWSAMARWYSQLLAQRAQMSPQLAARLRAIAQPRVLPADMRLDVVQTRAIVARVWAYLSSHLAYLGNESGVHAYVPAPVGQVFYNQQGDCKDGALLLVSWLRAVGISADLALVRTPEMGPLAPPSSGGQVAATMAAFDHALVYIPGLREWIDTTAPHSGLTQLPAGDQNSLALIVRSGQGALVRVSPAVVAAAQTEPSLPLPAATRAPAAVNGAGAPALHEPLTPPQGRKTHPSARQNPAWSSASSGLS